MLIFQVADASVKSGRAICNNLMRYFPKHKHHASFIKANKLFLVSYFCSCPDSFIRLPLAKFPECTDYYELNSFTRNIKTEEVHRENWNVTSIHFNVSMFICFQGGTSDWKFKSISMFICFQGGVGVNEFCGHKACCDQVQFSHQYDMSFIPEI